MRELGLLALSAALTVVLAVAGIRWLAPGLLGLPVDLQVVQVSEEVAPFYDTVFDGAGEGVGLLRDPHTGVRGRPLIPELRLQGPHDVLGFRNRGVPNHADLIAIGDSQTYGVNVPFESSWPRQLSRRLGPDVEVYQMAAPGWAAPQYLDLFEKALALEPSVVVVAFYSGNDPRESFRSAYAIERWKGLRLDPSLGLADLRPVRSPPPPDEWWQLEVGGEPMVFTPRLRLLSHEDGPAVETGWAIMAEVARRIAARARERGVTVIFAVIPTKELAFAPLLEARGMALDPVYAELIAAERRNLARLAEVLAAQPGTRSVDLVKPLQRAVRSGAPAYRSDFDGHPRAAGHAAIAAAVERSVVDLLPRAAR